MWFSEKLINLNQYNILYVLDLTPTLNDLPYKAYYVGPHCGYDT